MAEHFRLSEASAQTCMRMQRLLRIADRPALLRLAFAKGLLSDLPIDPPADTKGPEIPLSVITRHDDQLYDALIGERLRMLIDQRERKRYYKQIIDVGFSVMSKEFSRVGDNSDYLVLLARSVREGESSGGPGSSILVATGK